MPTKIFVGRLSEGTTSEDVAALFRKFGRVTECDVISNFGFVVCNTINLYILILILIPFFLFKQANVFDFPTLPPVSHCSVIKDFAINSLL